MIFLPEYGSGKTRSGSSSSKMEDGPVKLQHLWMKFHSYERKYDTLNYLHESDQEHWPIKP